MIEPFTCSTSRWQCHIKISGNCIDIPSCWSHIDFIRSLIWHIALIGHFDDWHENEDCFLCLTRIFTTNKKIFIPRSMPSVESITYGFFTRGRPLSPKWIFAKAFGYRECHSSETLEPKVWPCHSSQHYLNKTFSHLGWLRFVAILSTFFKKRRDFSK